MRVRRIGSTVRRLGFTLIELLVVISIIGALVGILLPVLASARRTARQLQNTTQLRGIHQSLAMFAQGNNDWYPGITRDGQGFVPSTKVPGSSMSGATVEARYALLLGRSYFGGDYAIAPQESGLIWTSTSEDITTQYYSYAMLQINDTDEGEVGGVKDGNNEGRFREWSDTFTTGAVEMADRVTKRSGEPDPISGQPNTYFSYHTAPGEIGWKGSAVFNDNRTEFFQEPIMSDTQYSHPDAGKVFNPTDDIFAEDNSSTFYTGEDANAMLVAHGAATLLMP